MQLQTVLRSMLQEYLGHDFHNRIFKMKCKLRVASRSAPLLSQWKILGAHLVGKMRMLFLSNTVL